MRVAMIAGSFPLISETFILRQITGLIDLGHEVDIYAEWRPPAGMPLHPAVLQYALLARTTYIDLPPEVQHWDAPVWPITGQTWVPGEAHPVSNASRVRRAIPAVVRCMLRAPHTTLSVLRPREFGEQARSLSALHRLDVLAARRREYDVVHAHFGPIGLTFRFASRLWRAPLIVSFHGYDFSSWPREQGEDVYVPLFRTAALVTVNSAYSRGRVEALGCPPS
jgi:colanic acid/amylovoran biosynthesis glycosyltransferase